MTRGRPKVHADGRVVVGFRLDPELKKRLKIEAIRRDVSANLLVARAIEKWLEENEGRGV